jgi:hypothetical protein
MLYALNLRSVIYTPMWPYLLTYLLCDPYFFSVPCLKLTLTTKLYLLPETDLPPHSSPLTKWYQVFQTLKAMNLKLLMTPHFLLHNSFTLSKHVCHMFSKQIQSLILLKPPHLLCYKTKSFLLTWTIVII